MANSIGKCVKRFLWLLIAGCGALVAAEGEPKKELFELSVEELQRVKVKVTSVSKREQSLFEAPSAVYVVDSQDIRRMGLTNLPELIRTSSGTQVGQITSRKWAVSARGFNQVYSDNLLALVDGRTIYSPHIEGVVWEMQDYMLEDIDRLEIIRGPGASLWGSNAVNGVINVISKNSKDTQGTLFVAAGGNKDRQRGAVRHGGKIGQSTHYRIYGKHFDHDDIVGLDGQGMDDGWDITSGGFQIDSAPTRQDTWMLQGRLLEGGGNVWSNVITGNPSSGFALKDKNLFKGGHALGLWKHTPNTGSTFTLQGFFDRTDRNEKSLGHEIRNTVDFDMQHHYSHWKANDIVWGLGWRLTKDIVQKPGLSYVSANPPHRAETTYSGFIQDEFSIRPDFRVIAGSKIEHNVYTQFEAQPTVRFVWMPRPEQSVWGAVSRALRIPARLSHDMLVNEVVLPPTAALPLPTLIRWDNTEHTYKSTRVVAFELGHRMQPHKNFSSDLAAFYNMYKGVRDVGDTSGVFSPIPLPHIISTGKFTNRMSARTYGVEWLGDWQVCPSWRLKGGYSHLRLRVRKHDQVSLVSTDFLWKHYPMHQFQLHSILDLPFRVEWDAGFYYVSKLRGPENDNPQPKVSSYTRLDLRLGWQPIQGLRLNVVGQGLTAPRRQEETTPSIYRSGQGKIERGVYAEIRWDV